MFENNRVHGNADEGIHIGTGSHQNRFVGNTSADNLPGESLPALADGNVFVRNTLGPGGINSLYLKDSGKNLFEGNTFRGNTARIVGDAHDNQFVNNTFSGAGLHFQPYKGTTRSPSNNRVSGGASPMPGNASASRAPGETSSTAPTSAPAARRCEANRRRAPRTTR